ncbi:YgaP family membrane protein [Bradyrhizobium sp. AZCC 2289]|uniref:YgaP family membrane protein n=1 Tax=Bradyrhizobium sp. AZCC 2289 TaxID=3117026 RepID=UPI002FF41457
MFYRKNLSGWERAARVVGGAAMIAGGLLACSGVVTALTGFVGFCPMCAMVGRRLSSS